ncbi:MAG: 2-amino-4-hydroxy-6-hydroxymethyldihydropteridine diphosphokinase [Alphaproteobacteria bacterium]|nr:2-amino-4-hydroxy-6-hydroxymethyldihydropteridine diphosphokinase [Alphaproteobacteria bacterium]
MTSDDISFPVALALGSNLGDRLGYLKKAVAALGACMEIEAISSVYEAPALYVQDQPPFLNAVLTGSTKLKPLSFLWSIKNIEIELGRAPTFRYGPRIVDIDLLLYSDVVTGTPELTLPHPRMHERPFVLQPLNEIASQWMHPVFRKTISDLAAALPSAPLDCLGKLLP